MSYQKNDVLTVKIEDMGHDGEGIGCLLYTSDAPTILRV